MINEEENSKESNTNKEEKISKLKNVLDNVPKILRITVKLLFLSGIEYERFFTRKLYIPLIGALSEILESVKNIKDNMEKIELEKYLLDNEIFFILYIILLNSFVSENIKNTYKSLFITQNYLNKKYTFQDIIFDPEKINKKYITLYGFLLFYFLEFLLIYAPGKFELNQINVHFNLIKKYLKNRSEKDIVCIMDNFDKFANDLLNNNDFQKFETAFLSINEKNYFYFTLFIKTVLDANNKLKKDMIKEIENLLNSQIKAKVIEIISNENEKDKESIDLDNLIEEYRENVDEIEFKLKIQKIIDPDLNKLDIYYVEKDKKKKEEYEEKKLNIELEKLLDDKYKDIINKIYTLIIENNKKIKEITNEIENNELTNKYDNEKSINEIINNKKQQFESLIKIKSFLNELKLYKLFERADINDVSQKFKFYIDYYDYLKTIVPIKKENLFSKEEIIMEELVDYHGKYRHAIKELFIFDRIWSKQDLFFYFLKIN